MCLEFQMEETKDLSEPVIDNERMEIRSELSKMSMEEILRLKEELGSKLYNRAIGIGSSKKHHSKVTNKGKTTNQCPSYITSFNLGEVFIIS